MKLRYNGVKGFLKMSDRKDIRFTQEWYNELTWKSLPQWRKDQLIAEREEEEKQNENKTKKSII